MILLTGATGQLGSHLLYELTRAGKTVRALYRNENRVEVVKRIFSFYQPEYTGIFKKIEWFQADINDFHALTESMRDVNVVYHTAGLVSFRNNDRKKLNHTNIEGTANVVNACLEGNAKLYHVSSIAALGESTTNEPIDENIIWNQGSAASAYSISKFKGEMEVWRGIYEGLDAVIVNPSVIIGPGMSLGPGKQLFNSLLKGLKFYPSGSSGYVDVRDVARIMVMLSESRITGERFIVSAGNFPHRKVLSLLSEALNRPIPRIPLAPFLAKSAVIAESLRAALTGIPPRINRQTLRIAAENLSYSNAKINNALQLEFIPLEESLKSSVKFFNFFNQSRVTF